MKVPQNMPVYLHAYHDYLQSNQGRAFDVKLMERHWENFAEHSSLNQPPKRTVKPSKEKTKKSLYKALENRNKFLATIKDDVQREEVAKELSLPVEVNFNSSISKKETDLLQDAVQVLATNMDAESNENNKDQLVANFIETLQQSAPQPLVDALYLAMSAGAINHIDQVNVSSFVQVLENFKKEIDNVEDEEEKKSLLLTYATAFRDHTPEDLIHFITHETSFFILQSDENVDENKNNIHNNGNGDDNDSNMMSE